ncbi:lysozyme-like domain containing protein [Aquisalimonas sp.]|uniref:transglycosylase SLT domain-containing protein n=1 Tax=unclassified Aquisalimonas TaxID=2644645 RepID=UPI0025C4E312|nr:lysozyme-like domain containing protein [Aquisalimonas sp.]
MRAAALVATVTLLLAGCGTTPPDRTDNLCHIFDHQPRWYDYARESEERWGLPIATQMAFIRQESSFRHDARPPRTRLLGFIPWRRPSTAYGFAQAQNPVWGEYQEERGTLFSRRTNMRHALDFVGWYNQNTQDRLGISKNNPRHLYLAYHEGHAGYRRRNWEHNDTLDRAANRVERTAIQYEQQLQACEERFQCRRFWEIGPFCDP